MFKAIKFLVVTVLLFSWMLAVFSTGYVAAAAGYHSDICNFFGGE